MKFPRLFFALLGPCLLGNAQKSLPQIPQWNTHEITLYGTDSYENPYTDVEVWAVFTNQKKEVIKRPAFWDGSASWKIRFAPTDASEKWDWESFSSNTTDKGLHRRSGSLVSVPYMGSNELLSQGFLKMSPRHRNVMHRSGKSFLVVADTPWALPFRATREQAETYARDRKQKGFNTALMMTVQPDTKAEGPNERNTEQGFKRGFRDLSNGHINQMNVDYYQYYDGMVQTLLENGIVPVYQPVFHGYGWKGKEVLGRKVNPDEYVRYVKYLLARYGSYPAIWLLGADHNGRDPGIKESGIMLQEWDSYGQPTGIHYNPCDDYLAEWAKPDSTRKPCFHYNKTYQDKEWLDFQWAQTGHDNLHLYHKVQRMYDNIPTKASANGEPTYEGMNAGASGLGWWQGEEAWMQLMHGGTMGVVYGAASLWQWKVSPQEEGWPAWTDQPLSWEGALKLEGSRYVGLVAKILKGLELKDIQKRWDLAKGRPLLAKEGELYISYLNEGGKIRISGVPRTLKYRWVDPRTGEIKTSGKVTKGTFTAPDKNPWVLIVD
ncbi:MAG: DUF4038 domain-containing protein [Bacteroidota bacterium]